MSDLIDRLMKVEPDKPGDRTRWFRNPDGPDAADEIERLRGLLWHAWYEFNAIRAKDGAPEGVSEDYWDKLTNALNETLGEDAKPWASASAKKVWEQIEAKCADGQG